MMTKERKEALQAQITEMLDNEVFMEGLAKAASAEDVCQLLAANNIDATAEEVNELTNDGNEALKRMKENNADELSEEDLSSVAGGSIFWRGVAAVAVGVAGGAAIGFICGVCPAATPVCYKIAIGYGFLAAGWINAG